MDPGRRVGSWPVGKTAGKTYDAWQEGKIGAAMGDIQPGETLLLDDGKEVTVTSSRAEHAPAGETFTTYNFEVKDWHTYFVSPANDLDDDGFVWVHNTCASTGVPGGESNPHLEGEIPQPGTRGVGVQRAARQEVELVQKTGRGTAEWSA